MEKFATVLDLAVPVNNETKFRRRARVLQRHRRAFPVTAPVWLTGGRLVNLTASEPDGKV